MDLQDYDGLVVKAALQFRLDANLLRAIIAVESGGNPWKNRFEPVCKYEVSPREFAAKLCISYETELHNQHSSFGLMQVMGFLARELGFTDDILMLCDPTIGLFYGCKQLRRLSDRYGIEEDVISAYNQGSPRKTIGGMFMNQDYCNKVDSQLRVLRKLV